MRKILLIIAVLGLVQTVNAQWDMDWDWFKSRSVKTNPDAPIVLSYPSSRWTDTLADKSPIVDGWMKFSGSQYMGIGHNHFFNLVDAVVDSFRIEWWGSSPTGSNQQEVLTSYDALGNGWLLEANYIAGTFSIRIPGLDTGGAATNGIKIANYFENDTNIYKFGITFDGTTFRTYRNDSLQYSYTGTYTGTYIAAGASSLVIGGVREATTRTYYGDTYMSVSNLYAFKGKMKRVNFSKNDTLYTWNLANGNKQQIIPEKYVTGVKAFPDVILGMIDRYYGGDSTSLMNLVMCNGASSAGIDTMDAELVTTLYKRDYKDNFPLMGSVVQLSPTEAPDIMLSGFAGEVSIINGIPFIAVNDNYANGFTAFVADYDVLKGIGKWDGTEWTQIGLGTIGFSGTSGIMNIAPWGSGFVATGYDQLLGDGSDTISGIVKSADGITLSTIGLGLTAQYTPFGGAGFITRVINDTAYVGGAFTVPGGKSSPYFAKVNLINDAWDSCGHGLDGTAYVLQYKVWNGERGFLVGGFFEQAFSKGVTTTSRGLVYWSIDSAKYKSYNGLHCDPSRDVLEIFYDSTAGWIYFGGDFNYMTDGIDTARSRGLCRYKEGVGLQAIGTVGFNQVHGVETITGMTKSGDILYFVGQFTWFNNFYSRNIAGLNVVTGEIIDMGYGFTMRPEDIRHWTDTEGLMGEADKEWLIVAGDFMDGNGKERLNVSLYDPSWQDNNLVLMTHTATTSTEKKVFPQPIAAKILSGIKTQVDSAWILWKIGINGDTGRVSMTTTDNLHYTGTFDADSSDVAAGDTVMYKIWADYWGHDTATAQYSYIITPDVNITIPTDSLKGYWEFYTDRGLGFTTYAQKMPSLYVHGSRNGDTLQLGATSSAEADDPVDSTAFGFIYFDGTADGTMTTQSAYQSTEWTIVMKWRAYNRSYFFSNDYTGSSNWSLWYSHSPGTMEIKTSTGNYRSDWALDNDSVMAFTSAGDLFMNGVQRVNNGFTWTARANKLYFGNAKFTFYGKGRLGTIAVYNRILTAEELLQFND